MKAGCATLATLVPPAGEGAGASETGEGRADAPNSHFSVRLYSISLPVIWKPRMT
jgi:hypothetical protein